MNNQLTKNFTRQEFASHDGKPVPEIYWKNLQELAENLQVLRDELKKPVRIRSGYRTPQHNKEVGGVPNSQHLIAKAADIYVFGMSPVVLRNTIERLINAGKMKQGGLGIYNTFVHYDIRGNKNRWDNRTH